MIAQAWAKLDGDLSLPLGDHAADVSAVFEALLEAGWSERLARVLGRPLALHEVGRLAAAAYLHDMGKANAGFWRRQDPAAPRAGHLLELIPEGCPELMARLEPIWESWGEDAFLAMLAHHGRPVDRDKRSSEMGRLWKPSGAYHPIDEVDALIARAAHLHPRACGRGDSLTDPRALSLFAGLLTLADWIGSSAARFPLDGVTGEARERRSTGIARAAVTALGLDAGDEIRPLADTSFEAAFGFAPRGLQAAAGEAGDCLVILEAETGSGKTEAALWRFLRLYAEGQIDGLYLALPTRTSAVQMHCRVQDVLARVFGANAPQVTLAVPGYLRAGAAEGTRLAGWDVLWSDDPSDAARDARWSAEAAKQFLAARVAVGTVDQVLLSGLRVRHAHLRAACLSRSLLVVDEVHASDAYMTEVLAQVLENHLGSGGHAMLLSATLGAAARARLTRGRRAEPEPLGEAERLAYPALHGVSSAAGEVDGTGKTVTLERLGAIDDAPALAARALDAARAGARVLVIRNTVAGAVAVQEALEAAGGPLWTVAGVFALHHGRFAAEDRRALDAGIEAAFGKGRPAGGLVAVGTQTLEISLDLDADLMITDLAPMDVLLQRLGRLHRHRDAQTLALRPRPAGFEGTRAIVAVPAERDLSPFLGRVARRHGLGPSGDTMTGVYPDLAALEATWAELEARDVLSIPADNRALVERALHPEALDRVADRLGWQAFDARQQGARNAEMQVARGHALDLSIPFSELDPFPDEDIGTRLGARDLLLTLPEGTPGAFGPVTAVRVPNWMARDVPLDAEPRIEPREGGFTLILEGTGGPIWLEYGRLGLRVPA